MRRPEGFAPVSTSGAQPRPPRSPTAAPWRRVPCGPPQEYPQHEWPHPQPTTNRHSGFPRTAAARAVAQDAIYTCFHYEGQPSMARGPPLAEGRAPAPLLQKPTRLLYACSGLPSGPQRRGLTAWVPTRGCDAPCLKSPRSPHCTAFGSLGHSSARSKACRGPSASAAGRTQSSSSG